ncbi:hypothetical protein D3C74_345980 [compost metagenome]
MQIYRMRHYRRPQDARSQQNAVHALELRSEDPGDDCPGIRLGHDDLERKGQYNNEDHTGDSSLKCTVPAPLQLQNGE